jgi:hypothetical protein
MLQCFGLREMAGDGLAHQRGLAHAPLSGRAVESSSRRRASYFRSSTIERCCWLKTP